MFICGVSVENHTLTRWFKGWLGLTEREVHISRIEALGGILKKLGNFDPFLFKSDFNHRLILQKTIYLMQEFGLNIGYFYSWYIRGPYSPALTRDAYEVAKRFEDIPLVEFVDPKDETRFKQFLIFIKPKARNHAILEKIASIHFLYKMYPSMSRKEIFLKTKAKIPSLTWKEFDSMCKELADFGLLKEES